MINSVFRWLVTSANVVVVAARLPHAQALGIDLGISLVTNVTMGVTKIVMRGTNLDTTERDRPTVAFIDLGMDVSISIDPEAQAQAKPGLHSLKDRPPRPWSLTSHCHGSEHSRCLTRKTSYASFRDLSKWERARAYTQLLPHASTSKTLSWVISPGTSRRQAL